MKITVYGGGYVGLVTGACLAQVGNHVVCADVDPDRVVRLNRGEVPIYEPGLEPLIRTNLAEGRLRFTDDLAPACHHGLIQFVTVGTPSLEDGSVDLSQVDRVAEAIGRHLDHYVVVVNKSTVPVGTADRVRQRVQKGLSERRAGVRFDVASNPEFLKEGAAVEDFMRPARIIVGTDTHEVTERLRELYGPFNRNRDRLLEMDIRSAELTKYAANAMLATKISFINEIAEIASRVGADVEQVRIGIGADPRIGYHFIYPGAGYGGSCFPKDVRAIQHTAREAGLNPLLLEAVEQINERQKEWLYRVIEQHFGGAVTGKTIAVWGLAFKPNTDDLREAPSLRLIERLWSAGARVRVHDPVARDAVAQRYGQREDLVVCESPEDTVEGADALAIVTEWNLYRSPDFELLRARLREPVIFDGRNLFEPEYMQREGITYYAVGRPVAKPGAALHVAKPAGHSGVGKQGNTACVPTPE